MGNSDFDIDFADGYAGEELVKKLLTGGYTVEVKTDRRWHETGNIYVETSCWYNRSNSWEPSGLTTSKADYWAYVLQGTIILTPTDVLRETVLQFGRDSFCAIPPNNSKGRLIKPEHILSMVRYKTQKDPHPGRDT